MNTIDAFLTTHSADIPPKVRATVRECILKGYTRTATELIPDHLRYDFRRAIEAEYRARCNGDKYTAKDARKAMPTAGQCFPSKITQIVRL